MAILERLDVAINKAQLDGREVIEIDITPVDYRELMTFAAQFDEAQLEELQLDMARQTYCGHKLVIEKDLPESGIVRDDGAEALPDDDVAHLSERLTIGEGLLNTDMPKSV